MTGRTHDLAAFTALTIIAATQPLPEMSLATALVAVSANMLGGLAPDIDQPSAEMWDKVRAGSVIGRIIAPFLGGHRYISHSVIGIILFGFISHFLFNLAKSVILVNMEIVWQAFMIGFLSHLLMDAFTREGIPLLFPIPFKFGFPPFRFLRMKTSGILEKYVVFPGLLFLNGFIFYSSYGKFLDFFKHHMK